MLRIPVAEGGLFDSRAPLPIWEELMKIVDNGSGMGAALRRERERLLKPLVQERNGPLPGKESSLGDRLRRYEGVILREVADCQNR